MSDEGDSVVCKACGQQLSVPAQAAFARAESAFLSARDSPDRSGWAGIDRRVYRAKARPDALPLAPGVVRDLQQAYAGLTAALRYGLPASQERAAVTMMAEVMRLLAPRGMASPLEAEYWIKLAFQLTARDELRDLQQRLESLAGSEDLLQRILRRVRRRQLLIVSAKLHRRLEELERAIGFVEPPNVLY